MSTTTRVLQATAAGHALISVGHTMTAPKFMNDPLFLRLPRLVRMYSRAGWYQGSVFFFITAVMNYRWSQNPSLLSDRLDKAIAALTVLVYWGSAAWYLQEGDAGTGRVLGLVGGLQAWALGLAFQ